ncbi:MAG: hypothetical protein F4W95_07780 [Chloroflexi bacterium]|nr:hypothetical protein [Chloroflexota bacterium]MYD48370.1 hypothetical protein [Chloroflexota bacterium]
MTTQPKTVAQQEPLVYPSILPGTTIGGEVGIFNAPLTVYSPDMDRSRSLVGLVDTGALHTVIPAAMLEDLDIPVYGNRQYQLADGSAIAMPVGSAQIELEGEIFAVPVLFGTDRRNILIGATTLETFGWAADVKNRRFIPADLTL